MKKWILSAVLLATIGATALAQDTTAILGLWVKLQAVSPLKAFVYKG